MTKRLAIVFILFAILGYCSASVASAQDPVPPPVVTNERIGFDYLDSELTNGLVNRFEVSVDGGAWESIGIPTERIPLVSGPAGFTYLLPVRAFTPGQHVLRVRACNPDICSAEIALTIRFTILPGVVQNLRVVRGQ